MFSPLRNRFGIPGAISVIALVFAMLGGAYAASNSDGGKAGASAKAKRGPRGPKGPAGPAGPAGPQGSAGPQGAAGANGKDGANGTNGKDGIPGADGVDGAPGKSVLATEIAAGFPECHEDGGVELEVEDSGTPFEICNGKQGKDGPEGKPWTPNSVLPKGATETGAWAFFSGGVQKFKTEVKGIEEEVTVGNSEAWVPISFPIQLLEALKGSSGKFHFATEANFVDFDEGGPGEIGCKGNVTSPSAPEGHLCVYGSLTNASFLEMRQTSNASKGISKTGGFLKLSVTGSPAQGTGSWAITGF